MRLTCPNCDAEYSVDDAAIPPGGRDVQCSNCGHAWFQMHPAAEAEAAAFDPLSRGTPLPPSEAVGRGAPAGAAADAAPASPDASPPADAPADAPEAAASEPSGEAVADDDGDDDGNDGGATRVQPAEAPAAPRSLDDNLLAILREEAAREAAERRAEAPAMPEVQPDLGLTVSAPAPVAATADAAPAPAAPVDLDAMEAGGATGDRAAPRRDLLPDIEEINSTLRAGNEARGENAEAQVLAEKARARGGFRAGFIATLAVAVLLTATYTMAPRIAQHLPGSAPAMASYVAGVDVARLWLDDAMQKAAGALRGLTGETL